jgi:RHS repeat-associated protein
LNRLVQSASSVQGHGMSFAYDGFGNLTQQGQTSLSIDPATNQITSPGYQYNANGNVIRTPDPATNSYDVYSYDVANRVVSNGAYYNPRNQRVFDGWYIYLYTPEGKLAGKYQPAWNAGTAYIQGGQPNIYFAGMLIQEQGHWVMTDRLGSVRWRDTGERPSYQPYGAEVAPATTDQRTKFATYFRDSPGLDYAGQRYYGNAMGRFLTPDPYMASNGGPGDVADPGSWNRYTYAGGDPVNYYDPEGEMTLCPRGTHPIFNSPFSATCVGGPTTGNLPPGGPSRKKAPIRQPPADPGGGGGGLPQVTALSGVPKLLRAAIYDLNGNCANVLPNQQTLLADATDLQFVDARANASGNQTVAQIAPALSPYNPPGTLQTMLGGANALILFGPPNGSASSISNTVILGQQFFLDPPTGVNSNYSVGQGTVLLHELLHYAVQMGDDLFVSDYGITQGQFESSSSAINRWLQNDCKN